MESGSNAGSVPRVLDSHGGKHGKAPQTELFVAAAHGLSHASRTAARSGHATALDQGDCWRPGGATGSAVKGLAMPHPPGDVDAWMKLAVETKVNWKQLVKPVLTHVGSSALETGETVRFPECHKDFFIRGLGALRARVHGVSRVARTVVDRSGVCPVCRLFFHSRRRMIHHIEHNCESCKAAL